jgi:predicted Rossmann fold flavoprotein
MKRIIVIGGGAAGMLAAIAASGEGNSVLLLEKNEKLGKKLFITGKGRCNVTNTDAPVSTKQSNSYVIANPKFLYSAFSAFPNTAMMELLENAGCPLKIERGNRVFPVSDHAYDVIAALQRELHRRKVAIRYHAKVVNITTEPPATGEVDKPETNHVKAAKISIEPPIIREVDKPETNHVKAAKISIEPPAIREVVKPETNHVKAAKISIEPPIIRGVDKPETNHAKTAKIAPDPSNIRNVAYAGMNHGNVEKAIAKMPASKKDMNSKLKVTGVVLENEEHLKADRIIIACGGLSYPSTGSDGDGYRLAAALGHQVTDTYPALVPMTIQEDWCKELQGLSLKNVELRLYPKDKPSATIYQGFGEMLFTHFGVSGPLVLSASSYYQAYRRKRKDSDNLCLSLNLKPALDADTLDKRLQKELEQAVNKQFHNAVASLFPSKLLPVMIKISGIPANKPANSITKEERKAFTMLIQHLDMTVTGVRGFDEAVITAGGISVKEVSPSTMESKLVSGLYFAGEILDTDALTGGFNLQIAWSTGYVAGKSAGS